MNLDELKTAWDLDWIDATDECGMLAYGDGDGFGVTVYKNTHTRFDWRCGFGSDLCVVAGAGDTPVKAIENCKKRVTTRANRAIERLQNELLDWQAVRDSVS